LCSNYTEGVVVSINEILESLPAVAVAYGYTVAAWPTLRMQRSIVRGVSACVGIVVLFCPLFIPGDRVICRALAAFLCIELMCKMIDYARQQRRQGSSVGRFVDYVRFLIPFPALLCIFGERQRRLPRPRPTRREAMRTILGTSVFASGFVLVHVAAQIPAIRSSFPLDHAVKLLIFVVTIEALSNMAYGLERLAGFDTKPLIDKVFLSRTVAEFWCRYNTRVHSWLDCNIFRPSDGRRAPVRGVLLTFFVSAVLHELMFGIATSRFDGYQFTFFMLQAPAVLMSRRLRRFATRGGFVAKAAAHTVTIVWMSVTSILFFHGVNRVFPFFSASEPWLP